MGVASGTGRGLFWWAHNLTWVSTYFSQILKSRLLIQGPGGLGGWVAYSAFTVPNLVVASSLLFPLCFPQMSFMDRSGLQLGVAGSSALNSNLGMD